MKTYTVKVDNYRTQWFNEKGQLHREDDLPANETKDGFYKAWHKEGKLHRVGNPARVWSNGNNEWYIEGDLHREDGPAIEYEGSKEYWLNAKRLTKEQWEAEVAKRKLPPAVLEAYKLLEANGFKITK